MQTGFARWHHLAAGLALLLPSIGTSIVFGAKEGSAHPLTDECEAKLAEATAEIARLKQMLAPKTASKSSSTSPPLLPAGSRIVLYNGASEAIGLDGPCEGDTSARNAIHSLQQLQKLGLACQVRCKTTECANAFRQCVAKEDCVGVSLNKEASWGTLKFSFDWWVPPTISAYEVGKIHDCSKHARPT